MKKNLSIFIITIMLALILSGCSATTPSLTIKANWYTENNQENIVYIYEKTEYKVSYNPANDKNTTLDLKEFTGNYKMVFTTSFKLDYYILQTEFSSSGKYVNTTTKVETAFNDTVVTETTFKSIKNKLMPIKSQKTYKGHTPLSDGSIELYEYEHLTEYEGNKATAKLISHSDSVKNVKEVNIFEKIDKNFTYFDNEQLYFAIRSLSLTEKYSATLSTVIPLDQQMRKVGVKVLDEAPYVEYNLETMGVIENEAPVTGKKVKTIKTTVGLDEKMAGAATTCYYAVKADGFVDYKARLIKMETPLPYDLGNFDFVLSSVVYSESTK